MEIYLNGIYEKSINLSNQQETLIFKFKGSSETYTQSSSLKDDLNKVSFSFNSAKPSHILSYDNKTLEWFIGFTEGDGCFIVNNKTKRPSFVITQKDPKVLYYLKKFLGFGKIYLCKDSYYRYIVSKYCNLQYLIQIFSGKLILAKSNIRYLNWVNNFVLYYRINSNIIIKSIDLSITNKSSWLSGFIDAEGCFDCYKRAKRFSFRMRFSIKQKDNAYFLNDLPFIWDNDLKNKVGHIAVNKKITIYTIDSIVKLRYLIEYLNKFPLHSNKNISYNKWLRLYRILLDGGRGKNYEMIKKLAQNINKFEDEDKVQK